MQQHTCVAMGLNENRGKGYMRRVRGSDLYGKGEWEWKQGAGSGVRVTGKSPGGQGVKVQWNL